LRGRDGKKGRDGSTAKTHKFGKPPFQIFSIQPIDFYQSAQTKIWKIFGTQILAIPNPLISKGSKSRRFAGFASFPGDPNLLQIWAGRGATSVAATEGSTMERQSGVRDLPIASVAANLSD
jgi:hypothetical protein